MDTLAFTAESVFHCSPVGASSPRHSPTSITPQKSARVRRSRERVGGRTGNRGQGLGIRNAGTEGPRGDFEHRSARSFASANAGGGFTGCGKTLISVRMRSLRCVFSCSEPVLLLDFR